MPLTGAEKTRRWRDNREKQGLPRLDVPRGTRLEREAWVKARADWGFRPHVCLPIPSKERVEIPQSIVHQWVEISGIHAIYGPGTIRSWWSLLDLYWTD